MFTATGTALLSAEELLPSWPAPFSPPRPRGEGPPGRGPGDRRHGVGRPAAVWGGAGASRRPDRRGGGAAEDAGRRPRAEPRGGRGGEGVGSARATAAAGGVVGN